MRQNHDHPKRLRSEYESVMSSFQSLALDKAHELKCELAGEVLRSSGKLRLQVTGWSMLPSVWPGDMLMIERTETAAVSAGDIVLFRRDRRLFAHRVIKDSDGTQGKIVTKGDGMLQSDSPVAKDELLGKICGIVRNGRHLEPRTLNFSERAVAALVQRSSSAARLAVGIHGIRRAQK